MKKILLFLLFATSFYATAQTVVAKPGQLNNLVQMVPGAIPTSSKCLVGIASTCIVQTSSTPYVCAADFTGTGQTITLQDGQATPVVWLGGAVLGAIGAPVTWLWNSPIDSGCRAFPYGVYIVAGSSGATGSVTIKY